MPINIFNELQTLNFPSNEYVMVGSGPMIARSMRDTNDVDIVVTPNLFEACKNAGWEQRKWTYPEKEGQIFLRKGNVELFRDVNCGNANPTFQELRDRADIIKSFPFASLQDVIQFKEAYFKVNGKEKHNKDIQLIKQYLNQQH